MTRKQKALLDFIIAYQRDNEGISPSYDEMKDALGLASKSGINRLMVSLKDQGFIHFRPSYARQIFVLCPPDKTPKPPREQLRMNTIQLSEYLARELGVEEWKVRRALLEIPA